MRTLIRGIVEAYRSPRLEGQEEGFVIFQGQEPDSGLPVSIRILARTLSDKPQINDRFQRLAQALRALNHPNIAPVQKVGDNAGVPFLVTRLIERARPLTERLNQPWAVDMAADIVMQAGRAVEHAYNKGVVHGELTPDKIVVQEDGHVRVTDFGMGTLLDLAGVHARQAASPYVAPERLAGSPADGRADVYSLAAILYGLLTQRAPVLIQGKVMPPSRFQPEVPAAMDEVILKGLAPDPKERYGDVKAFLAALGAVPLAAAVSPAGRDQAAPCPYCGAERQTGQFCRRCGKRLDRRKAPPATRSKLDEPIQVTQIEVSSFRPEAKVEQRATVIAQPMTVASGTLSDLFPKPLEMPRLEMESLWPTADAQTMIPMPEPPPMPVVDWGEIAPPMPVVPSIEEAMGSSRETESD